MRFKRYHFLCDSIPLVTGTIWQAILRSSTRSTLWYFWILFRISQRGSFCPKVDQFRPLQKSFPDRRGTRRISDQLASNPPLEDCPSSSLLTTDELDITAQGSMVWSEVDFGVENLEPSDDPNVLGRLGGCDVLEIIGRGGMGVVLKAFDSELKRLVAIKVLSPHLAHSSVAPKRFTREAQAAAAVVNPHVIAIHQVQPSGRLPFLTMPLLAGESLAQRLRSRGPLSN